MKIQLSVFAGISRSDGSSSYRLLWLVAVIILVMACATMLWRHARRRGRSDIAFKAWCHWSDRPELLGKCFQAIQCPTIPRGWFIWLLTRLIFWSPMLWCPKWTARNLKTELKQCNRTSVCCSCPVTHPRLFRPAECWWRIKFYPETLFH